MTVMKLGQFLCHRFFVLSFFLFVGLDGAQNTKGIQMHMNNYNQSKHLD